MVILPLLLDAIQRWAEARQRRKALYSNSSGMLVGWGAAWTAVGLDQTSGAL
jgi:hypothetical protein